MSVLSYNTAKEIDVSGIISAYVYMDEQHERYDGRSLKEILMLMPDEVKDDENYKAVVNAVEENPGLGELKLISQSMVDGNYDEKLVIACAFQDPATDTVYVSYRGTGDGKWVDNGEGMTKSSTIMQRTSAEYFDYVVENCVLGTELEENKIVVTGHSKGGNEAQYVTLMAKNRDCIDNCYSLDGQGFSWLALLRIRKELGDDYEKYLKKMYSVNGRDDYVHDLGFVIIPEERTYFVDMPDVDGIADNHSLLKMLDGARFNWTRDENNDIVPGEQGEVGKTAKKISAILMAMPIEKREDCAITVMWLLEAFMKYESGENYWYGTGNRKIPTPEEVIGCIQMLMPVVLIALGWTAMEWVGKKLEEIVDSIKNFFEEKFREIRAWYNKNLNRGYNYASENPEIRVDTAKLRNYASRLRSINRRIATLDSRMDGLYCHAGLFDLWNLIQADLFTGYSWRLNRCTDYLEDTAGYFESAESAVNGVPDIVF